MPTTGPGWDAHHIYLGVLTVTDAPTVGRALGVNSLDYGDQKKFISVMTDYVNKHGGLFGRQLVVVAYDVPSYQDASTTAEAACAKFTQDERVAVALGDLGDDTYLSCMKNAHVPVISDGYGKFFRDSSVARYNGWLYYWLTMSFDRMVPVWLSQLRAHGFFQGWNTSSGTAAPGPGGPPVKVGLLYTGDGYRPQAFAYLKAQLQQRGIDVAADLEAASPSDYSNDVLQFRSAGVTHLFMDSSAALFYPQQAESQRFYARYAVESNDFIQAFLQDSAPKNQLRGMMGVGWIPNEDVDLARNPGPNPGQRACLQIMRDNGADVSKDNYQYTAEVVCDDFFFFLDVAHAAGGLNPASLFANIPRVGAGFRWASQLGTGIASSDITGTPGLRALEYVESCSCVQYVGPYIKVP